MKLLIYDYIRFIHGSTWHQIQHQHQEQLTHCGLMTPYGIMDLSQHRTVLYEIIVNSLWPSDTIWLQMVTIASGDGLVPDSTEPLPEPMLTYCQFDHGNKLKWNFNENIFNFIEENAFEEVSILNDTHFVQGPLLSYLLTYCQISNTITRCTKSQIAVVFSQSIEVRY